MTEDLEINKNIMLHDAKDSCWPYGGLIFGDIKVRNPFFLAPMAGITDPPTRSLYWDMGCGLIYTEMVSAKGMYYGDRKSGKLLEVLRDCEMTAFQIFGHEPSIMAFAAEKLNDLSNVILDVNMGCPVPKVVKNGDGSAMLEDPENIYNVIKAMKEATDKPITAKIRTGFRDSHTNCVEVAKAIEEAGAMALTVHGRTREQYYTGIADRQLIASVVRSVKIPVVANGDVDSFESYIDMVKVTGTPFVMIGRAAMGNPWIFSQLVNQCNAHGLKFQNGILKDFGIANDIEMRSITVEEKKAVMKKHLLAMVEYKGERVGIREMRKQLAWYTKGMKGSNTLRRCLNTIENFEELISVIDSIGK